MSDIMFVNSDGHNFLSSFNNEVAFYSFSYIQVLWRRDYNNTNVDIADSNDDTAIDMCSISNTWAVNESGQKTVQHGNTVASAPIDTQPQIQTISYIVKKTNISGNEVGTQSQINKECEFVFIHVHIPVVMPLLLSSSGVINADSMEESVVPAHKLVKKEGLPNYLGTHVTVPSQGI